MDSVASTAWNRFDLLQTQAHSGFRSTQVRQTGWLLFFRRYVVVAAAANLIWEFAQMPLYTAWQGSWPTVLLYGLHCLGGDIIIASACLWTSLILMGTEEWPALRFNRVALATISLGIAYTIFSEWVNVEIRRSWAYAESMPRLPVLGTGLAPLIQWIVIPPVAFACAERHSGGAGQRP